MNLPTTHMFSVTRGGTANTLTDLAAYLQPANQGTTILFQDIPAGELYSVIFDGQPALKKGDLLVSETDSTETYLVRQVAKNYTPRLGHTSAVVQGQYGT